MIKTYFLSIGFIFLALFISYLVGLQTIKLVKKLSSNNTLDAELPIIPIGFGMISLVSNYLYFNFHIS